VRAFQVEKVIIEARINEYAMRDMNHHVPWTVEEIVKEAQRVRDAGASILHFHARTGNGAPNNSAEVYGEIIKRIREKTDILILPTLGFNSNDKVGGERIKIITKLAELASTKPDIIPLDMGSINLEQYDKALDHFDNASSVYCNPTDVLEFCAQEMLAKGIKVKMTCWDVGFVRRGKKFLDLGLITKPGYFLFHLTEGRYLTGHPCTKEGIDALRHSLPDGKCYWTVNCLGGNLLSVAQYVLDQGGNIAIGIGDYHYGELGSPTNEELIRKIVEMARACKRQIASPAEVKEMLQIGK
jgi:3-keto-5-aminohexanoate cleavage enzyme